MDQPEPPTGTRFIPWDKVWAKVGKPTPEVILELDEAIDAGTRLEEFRVNQRGGTIDPGAVDRLVKMKLHKYYLYGLWCEDRLDEDAERARMVEVGFLAGANDA